MLPLFLTLLSSSSSAQPQRDAMFKEQTYMFKFSQWYKEHNKTYTLESFPLRYAIFKKNHDYIEAYNAANNTAVLGLNQFSDLTSEEFAELISSEIPPMPQMNETLGSSLNETGVPASVDWVMKGAVSRVKNQGKCGSCWTFSTTGATEGAIAVKTGKLVSLSEQNLLDCAGARYNNRGCHGGMPLRTYPYVRDYGICMEQSYMYQMEERTCRSSSCGPKFKISSFSAIPSHNPQALQYAAAQRPISVIVDASSPAWQHYRSGFLSSADCQTSLNHAVLLVGYGNQRGTNVWKIKNSWSERWGVNGYIYLSRPMSTGLGTCGVLSMPSYAIA